MIYLERLVSADCMVYLPFLRALERREIHKWFINALCNFHHSSAFMKCRCLNYIQTI